MNKNLLLAIGILSIICLAGAIFICTVEQSAGNYALAAIFFVSAVYFIYQYRMLKKKDNEN